MPPAKPESGGGKENSYTRIIWAVLGCIIILLVCALIGTLTFFLIEREHFLSHRSGGSRDNSSTHDSDSCGDETSLAEIDSAKSNTYPARRGYVKQNNTLEELILPRSFEPEQYWLTIKPLIELRNASNATFIGNVTILMKFTGVATDPPVNKIVLHAKDLSSLHSISIKNVNDSKEKFTVDSVEQAPVDRLIITCSTNFQAGRWYQISIWNFVGKISNSGRGFYLSSYVLPDEQPYPRFLAVTQFEVANARMAFPCLDEPHYKANFTLTIIRRNEFRSLSNMPRRTSRTIDDEWIADYFDTSVKMSSYLLAWCVSDFHYHERTTKTGILVRAHSRPDAINDVDYALDMSVRIFDYFTQYFGMPYSLSKCDLVALPDFSHGAMENWGMVTFRETTMLYNPNKNSLNRKKRVAVIVGHEVAHQWFGNIVTMEWWTDLWLNEGFAHFMAYVSSGEVEENEDMKISFILENVILALDLDSLNSTHPVVTEAYDTAEILQLFDAITYRKGSCLIRMMRDFLGERTFQRGLQIYLRRHAFGNAVSADLWAALDKAVSESPAARARMQSHSVGEVMDNWVNQPGYPYVEVTRDYNTHILTLSQKKFVIDPVARMDSEQQWIIPFMYLTKGSRAGTWRNPSLKWIPQNENVSLRLPVNEKEWVFGNVNYNGFYRVNYDRHNWNLIMNQLRNNHLVFPTISRAQILEDSFDLSRAGLLNTVTALNATRYLHAETEYLPWVVALSNFKTVNDMLQDLPMYENFLNYMNQLLEVPYERLCCNATKTDSLHLQTLRFYIVEHACKYAIPQCIQRAQSQFRDAMNAGTLDLIEPGFKRTTICTALREGGVREWKFAWKQFLREDTRSVRKALIRSLGCTRIGWLQNKLLYDAMDPNKVRVWDIPDLVDGFGETDTGRRTAWSFMKENWEVLTSLLGEIAGKMVSIITVFNHEWQLEDLEQFMAKHEFEHNGRIFNEAREAIRINVKFKQTTALKIDEWLKSVVNSDEDMSLLFQNFS